MIKPGTIILVCGVRLAVLFVVPGGGFLAVPVISSAPRHRADVKLNAQWYARSSDVQFWPAAGTYQRVGQIGGRQISSIVKANRRYAVTNLRDYAFYEPQGFCNEVGFVR